MEYHVGLVVAGRLGKTLTPRSALPIAVVLYAAIYNFTLKMAGIFCFDTYL